MKILGLITARGGSKGIPGKNIKPLRGKPLIAYSIETAQKSGVFDRLILSTDDEKIASVVREYGVEVPFMRPAELAQDAVPHLPVVQHAVGWLREKEGYYPEAVMILQPTCPLRQPVHIQESARLLGKGAAESVVSVSRTPDHYNPHWQFTVDRDGFVSLFSGEPVAEIIRRRQDLPPAYSKNGAIFLFKTGVLSRDPPSFYGERTLAYMMDDCFSINIDDSDDWERAERILSQG